MSGWYILSGAGVAALGALVLLKLVADEISMAMDFLAQLAEQERKEYRKREEQRASKARAAQEAA